MHARARDQKMSEKPRTYVAIDLKSFYASVECRERGLDPLTTNLVVADASRTEKTICLAVSPSLKKWGIPGRPRLFEVISRVKEVNRRRQSALGGGGFEGESVSGPELEKNPALKVSYLTAPPRMKLYMDYSTRIYRIYLRYIAPEDIHVYSIDEVMMDVTDYLGTYGMSAHELCRKMIREVLEETGITATGGIGTNLYLCKAAMDIVSKHIPEDEDGVRIAELDERSYRLFLWTHRPLTDFWRVGRATARKLEKCGLMTMGDVARCSLENEELLYDMFGINAQLLIDHAWGYEDARISDIKSYVPKDHSISSGQVLAEPYPSRRAKIVADEMADMLAMELMEKGMGADQMVLTVCYDVSNLKDKENEYSGETARDWYGRKVPRNAQGSINLGTFTSSGRLIREAVASLYERIVDPALLVRRIYLYANHVRDERSLKEEKESYRQMSLFEDGLLSGGENEQRKKGLEREKKAQEAVLEIRKRFGKNAIMRGSDLQKGATFRERNDQVGGHKA